MKNIDVVNNIISNKTGIDEKIVKAVNKYYWSKGVKKNLSKMHSNALFVRNIGTFVASRYNIRSLISKTIRQIRGVRLSIKYKETTKEIYIADLYERLRVLLKARNEIAKQYKETHDKRIFKTNSNSSKEY